MISLLLDYCSNNILIRCLYNYVTNILKVTIIGLVPTVDHTILSNKFRLLTYECVVARLLHVLLLISDFLFALTTL